MDKTAIKLGHRSLQAQVNSGSDFFLESDNATRFPDPPGPVTLVVFTSGGSAGSGGPPSAPGLVYPSLEGTTHPMLGQKHLPPPLFPEKNTVNLEMGPVSGSAET